MTTFKPTLLFLFCLLLFSCDEEKESCKISIKADGNLIIEQVKLNNETESFKPFSENGYIVFLPAVKKPGYFVLTMGGRNISLFLTPGDNIFIASGANKSNNQEHFSGKGALLSNYLLDDNLLSQEIQNNTNFDSIYSLPAAEFTFCIDSIYNKRTLNLEAFIKKNRIRNEVFVSAERKRIFYASAIEKNQYYRDHKFLTGEIPVLNQEYDQYLEKADFNDSVLLHLGEYKKFLNTYFERIGLQHKDMLENQERGIHFIEYSYSKAKETVCDKKVKNYVLYKILDFYVNDTPVDYSRNLISDFNEECTNSFYKESINNQSAALDRLKKGMPAPDFIYPDTAAREVSLSGFKGKLVYIDVWNSNCSPCFREFPVMEQLINKYSGKDIVFMGISFDSDKNLWGETIKTKKLKGIQLFASGWNSQFGKDYMVWSNPRFILIDRNGNIISAKAPGPSENADALIEQNL